MEFRGPAPQPRASDASLHTVAHPHGPKPTRRRRRLLALVWRSRRQRHKTVLARMPLATPSRPISHHGIS
jgi:hypothetical protein